jgi:hypothetical protein
VLSVDFSVAWALAAKLKPAIRINAKRVFFILLLFMQL